MIRQHHFLLNDFRLSAIVSKWCIFIFIALFTLPLSAQDAASKKRVDIISADFIRSLDYNGKTINRLIGNVQLMHNGALMYCDSAYLFSSSEFEAYSRIVIVKDATYLYGDLLEYDGSTNIAKVRGKIVRLFDSTATLRTQHLDFNTKENIGHFFNGGTIDNNSNILESLNGHYYSNDKLFIFADSIELHNETYDIKSNSGTYNTRTDVVTFTSYSNIWHKDGFLSCDYGWYDKARDYFHFSKSAYVQSKEQEIWADSIFYDRRAGKSDLYGNVQILDTVQQAIAFGGEGHSFDNPRRATLTKNPSVAYYTYEDGKADTLFIRADTLKFITAQNPAFYKKDTIATNDSIAPIITEEKDSTNRFGALEKLLRGNENFSTDDSLAIANDSLAVVDSTLISKLSEIISPPNDTTIISANDTIIIQEEIPILPKEEENISESADSTTIIAVADTISIQKETPPLISEEENNNELAPIADTVTTAAIDSTIRQVFAFLNARAYRQDVQAACDSFAYSSLDSLGRMFGRPIMWNNNQQITANQIHFLSDADKKKMIRADFLESAFIISHEQDTFYNQIKGRDMIGHFRDNDLHLLDVIGGAQTVYYLQEDSMVANGNLAESTTMKIIFKKQKIQYIKYITKPDIVVYPLDQFPQEKATLKGFEWRDSERPKSRWEICTEIARPSQRQESQAFTKPAFPITERINAIK